MFKAYEEKGFQLEFSNGFEISVMFGKGNYCSRRYNADAPATTAEVAIFRGHKHIYADNAGKYRYEGGWLNADQVAKIIAIVPSFHEAFTSHEISKKISEALAK